MKCVGMLGIRRNQKAHLKKGYKPLIEICGYKRKAIKSKLKMWNKTKD